MISVYLGSQNCSLGSTDSSRNPNTEDGVFASKGEGRFHQQKKGLPVGADKLSHSCWAGGSLTLSSDGASRSPLGRVQAGRPACSTNGCWLGPDQMHSGASSLGEGSSSGLAPLMSAVTVMLSI